MRDELYAYACKSSAHVKNFPGPSNHPSSQPRAFFAFIRIVIVAAWYPPRGTRLADRLSGARGGLVRARFHETSPRLLVLSSDLARHGEMRPVYRKSSQLSTNNRQRS